MQENIYNGPERILLVAFHLGATCARVSYSILVPGTDIQIKEIQSFPASGGSKVPYVIYYDSEGRVHAIGENERDSSEGVAGEKNLLSVPVKWSAIHSTDDGLNTPPLPLGKCPEDVLSDFLTHLNDEVFTYIRGGHPSIGSAVLDSLTIHYTFIAPSEKDETTIRSVAQKISMIKDEQDIAHITFLTEGEAYFEAYLTALTREEGGVCIVHIDHNLLTLSSFSYKGVPGKVEVITESQSNLQGYSAVNEEARTRITALTKGSIFEHKVPSLLESFDCTTKPAFCESDLDGTIKLRSTQDKKGKGKKGKGSWFCLSGETVASFFEPLIRSIVEGVLNQNRAAREPLSRAVLVGPGASSDYIFNTTKRRLGTEPPNVRVVRPRDHPGRRRVSMGGVARTIKCLHELITNVSNKEELPPAENSQPVFTFTDVPDNTPHKLADEAKHALKILESIVNTQGSAENQISELQEENEKLKLEAEIREREYLEIQEKNIRLGAQLKELEDWREKVMMAVGVIQEKTHEIIKTECPMPTVTEETGSSNG